MRLLTIGMAATLAGAAAPAPPAGPPIVEAPSPEADALGVRLARTTGLLTMAPMLIEKDLGELAGEDKTLSAADRERLMAIGRDEGRKGMDRIAAALGRGYARRLSLEDLRVLVAQNESPAAAHFRASVPAVMVEAMGALGAIDLKGSVAARMCKETGKMCARH